MCTEDIIAHRLVLCNWKENATDGVDSAPGAEKLVNLVLSSLCEKQRRGHWLIQTDADTNMLEQFFLFP